MTLLYCLFLSVLQLQEPPVESLRQEVTVQTKSQIAQSESYSSLGNWTRFRGRNDNAGLAPDARNFGRLRWSFQAQGQVLASPIMDDKGNVYVASGHFDIQGGIAPGSLYALEAATGAKLWELSFDEGIGCTPTWDNGTLYVGCNDGRVYAIDSKTGTVKWKTRIIERYAYSSPVVVGDTLFVQGLGFYALDTKTGKVKWLYKECVGASSPAFWENKVFVGIESGSVLCFDAPTGKKLWQAKTGDVSWSAASINANGTLAIGDKTGGVTAVDAKTGKVRWTRKFEGWVRTTIVYDADGAMYFGTMKGKLFALNQKTGETLWSWQAPAEIFSSPTLTPSGRLYFGCVDGKMYSFDTKTQTKVWDYQTGGAIYSSPLLTTAGLLIFGSNDGKVYALE